MIWIDYGYTASDGYFFLLGRRSQFLNGADLLDAVVFTMEVGQQVVYLLDLVVLLLFLEVDELV
jgi:hypothetical protein